MIIGMTILDPGDLATCHKGVFRLGHVGFNRYSNASERKR